MSDKSFLELCYVLKGKGQAFTPLIGASSSIRPIPLEQRVSWALAKAGKGLGSTLFDGIAMGWHVSDDRIRVVVGELSEALLIVSRGVAHRHTKLLPMLARCCYDTLASGSKQIPPKLAWAHVMPERDWTLLMSLGMGALERAMYEYVNEAERWYRRKD